MNIRRFLVHANYVLSWSIFPLFCLFEFVFFMCRGIKDALFEIRCAVKEHNRLYKNKFKRLDLEG